METFTVVAVIDSNTMELSEPWEWNGERGRRVQASGYDAPKRGPAAMSAEQRLSVLIQNKKVELKNPSMVENGKLICDVYFQGNNIANYFREYKTEEGD